MSKRTSLNLIILAGLLLAGSVHAATESVRPRIGLVLGGGGARGAAHIGVLEVLEQLRVPVDCVAGTSMGALVAGAYAGGLTPGEMRTELGKADWHDMFIDSPDYSELTRRNKILSKRFLPGTETGVTERGAQYQTGMVTGQKIKLFFNQLVGADRGERHIEDLPLKLSIIATDIGNGERVVFRDGSLSKAMRASMSVPGLLSPVDHQGRKLVDGGLVDNVPIGEARERCQADVVIAVNVGTPLMKPEEVGSLLTVSAQMVNILTEQNVSRSLASLKPDDILIKPDLDGVSAGDFERHSETADRGRVAADAVRQQLARYSVPAPAYAAWREQIVAGMPKARPIDEVQVAQLKWVNPVMVDRLLGVKTGVPLDQQRLGGDLGRIYGEGHYETVDYSVLSVRDKTILKVTPMEKSWGPDYLRFAVNLESGTSQPSTFTFRGAYHKTWLNSRGGELLYSVQLGNELAGAVDYYQPIDEKQRFYFETVAAIAQSDTSIYQDNKRLAKYELTQSAFKAGLGVNVGVLGQVSLGWLERDRRADLETGTLGVTATSKRFGGWQAIFDFDQMDRRYFATKGWQAQAIYFDAGNGEYSRLDAMVQAAVPFRGMVFTGTLSYTGSPSGQLPYYNAGSIGGFGNLSGYARNQIVGDEITYASIRSEKIVGRLPLGLQGDMRLGISLEGARVGKRYTETNADGTLNSVAIYLGGETPLGPVYFGYGYARDGISTLFLNLGAM
jgi:NTE family protein